MTSACVLSESSAASWRAGIPPALNVAQILLVDIGTDILTAIACAGNDIFATFH